MKNHAGRQKKEDKSTSAQTCLLSKPQVNRRLTDEQTHGIEYLNSLSK